VTRPRAVGINHVALEVGSLDDALAFYGSIFELTLRGRGRGMAFVDLGDQFLALAEREGGEPDGHRHFGLVVDDKEAVRQAVREAGVDVQPAGHLRFRDPWGNNVEIVDYRDVQFTKDARVLRGMELDLEKREGALAELREKGLAD
jgi:catechol 2,3-dioxygenase-like lactoylglutathione lyase family enzyme